jgi:hypothetical protein
MVTRRLIYPLFPLLYTVLSACSVYSPTSSSFPTVAPSAFPDKSALSTLIGESLVNKEELQLRDTLQRKIDVKFPLKVGVVYYSYASQLETQDQQAIFEEVKKSFQGSGLIRETFQIPSSLLGSNTTMDAVRQLGARFQADLVIIVSGSHVFDRSKLQPLDFFDSFTDKAYYESRILVDAIALDIFSGTFMQPLRSVIQTPSKNFDRAASDFKAQTYSFRKDAESKLWVDLGSKFIDSLKNLKQEIEARTKASPAPAVPSPTITPFPEVSPTPVGGR